jgi:Conjugal transfer protein
VDLKEGAMLTASQSAPRFVPAQEVETYKDKLEKAQDETRQAKEASQTAIHQGITRFISNVRFPYRFEAGKKPFFVRAMYHDDRFTYIQARPQEAPALYEIKDGQPNLVNFEYKDGVYVVDKILDHGYLAIGKQKLAFASEE